METEYIALNLNFKTEYFFKMPKAIFVNRMVNYINFAVTKKGIQLSQIPEDVLYEFLSNAVHTKSEDGEEYVTKTAEEWMDDIFASSILQKSIQVFSDEYAKVLKQAAKN